MINTLITIGPASLNEGDLDFFSKHTMLFRLNGSHNSLEWHKKAVELIRRHSPNAFILMDIPGVKPRTSNIDEVSIRKGEQITFGDVGDYPEALNIKLTKSLPRYSNELKTFSINDGQFLFDVVKSGNGFITGASRENFTLLPKKGINLPGSLYDEAAQYSIYEDFIKSVSDLNIDALGLSFVQTGQLVNEIRQITGDLILISKVENSEGLRNVADIAETSDAIMIDRGDLVAEIGFNKLFGAIEEISRVTKKRGIPLIMATENLETMIERDLPSKSEVISLSHSASIGVDCFMLSEETALSENKRTIVNWLSNFLQNEVAFNKTSKISKDYEHTSIWDAMVNVNELPAIILSKSGHALFEYVSRKPVSNITLLTPSEKLKKLALLFRTEINVINTKIDDKNPLSTLFKEVKQNKEDIFGSSESVLAIYVSQYVNQPRANSISILNVADF